MSNKDPKPKKTRKLNDRQRLFCREYLKDFNGTQAAIRAGYSPDSAYSIAYDLLKKPEIISEIKTLVGRLLEEQEIQIARILQELYIIALSDITDFFGREEPWVETDPDTGEEKVDGRKELQMRLKEELGEKTRAIAQIEERSSRGRSVETKYKLHDKLKAIELIGKYLGMFKEELELSNPDGSLKPEVHIYVPDNGRKITSGTD